MVGRIQQIPLGGTLHLPDCRSLLTTLAVLGLVPFSLAQAPERIIHVAQHYAARDGFSGTVTFATAGKVVVRRGYGFADRTQKSSFDEHTRFSIGSISKQFTAAAILLLQEDGKLKTNDRVVQLLPEDQLPQAWSEITVRELLSHTSGIKDYASVAPQEMQREHLPAELLSMVKDAPLAFKLTLPSESVSHKWLILRSRSGMPDLLYRLDC